MPLILVPYTLGAQLPAAPGATVGGAGYLQRRKLWWGFLATVVLCLFS